MCHLIKHWPWPVFQLTVITGAASSSRLCAFSPPWLPPFSFHGVVKCPDGSEHCQAHTHTHQDLRRKGTMGVWGFPYPWPLEAKATTAMVVAAMRRHWRTL